MNTIRLRKSRLYIPVLLAPVPTLSDCRHYQAVLGLNPSSPLPGIFSTSTSVTANWETAK